MADPHSFQFHCMICYEEFDNSELRHPVILPCGHTYVCKCCGDKLDKCMECREPLFMTFQPEGGNNTSTPMPSTTRSSPVPATTPRSVRSTWSTARSGTMSVATNNAPHFNNNKRPNQKPVKKRLPLPKNVVLLSLIEATKMIAGESDQQHNPTSPQSTSSSSGISPRNRSFGGGSTAPLMSKSTIATTASADEEEQEHKRAQLAASVSAGIAGTYAVCSPSGLQIFPSRPKGFRRSSSSTHEDVESMVHGFHVDKMKNSENGTDSTTSTPRGSQDGDMATLAYGDRVQVVSMEMGWAKLARGYGFVRADKNVLVKVGNAVDRSCILEAMLTTLSQRRRELRAKQSENDTQFITLLNHLQASLQKDEDLTVICGTTFFGDDANNSKHEDADSFTEKKEDDAARAENPALEVPYAGRPGNAPAGTTLTPIETNVVVRSPHSAASSNRNANTTMFVSTGQHHVTSPSPSEMRAGALAWRERQEQQSINFRSGLSGHLALASNRAHPHEYLSGGGREGGGGSFQSPRGSNAGNTSTRHGGSGGVAPPSHINTRVTSFRMSTHTGLTMSHRNRTGPKEKLWIRSQVHHHIDMAGSM